MSDLAALRPAPREDLLVAYTEHVFGLAVQRQSRVLRLRCARRFLAHHHDLQAWLARPTPVRVRDLHNDSAWPFILWAAASGRVTLDIELLLAKPGGVDLALVWERLHPGEIAKAEAVCAELGWSANWARQVCHFNLPVVCTWAGKALAELTDEDLAGFRDAIERSVYLSESARFRARTRLFTTAQVCYQLGLLRQPPRRGVSEPARTPSELAALVLQPAIRQEVVRYAETALTTLRPASVAFRVRAVRVFTDWLATEHPEVARLDQLKRTEHIDPFLAWASHRPWRGANGRGRRVSSTMLHHDVVALRAFFEDITEWGWPSSPARRLLFISDIPRMPEAVPRALPPGADGALMAAVERLEDSFARTGLMVLRATGMRVGELMDLELDCLVDFGAHGTWLRVPLGKLGTERTVPLDQPTLEVFDTWVASRGRQRSLPHPRNGRPADFVFMERGRRPTRWRLAKGLDRAAQAAGLTKRDGTPLHLTVHQLRHTFGTSMINAGMSLPALMALMGHVTPEMTLRYARLASPVIREAYETAMGKVRARSALGRVHARPAQAPAPVQWLASEMLKTRLANGYCSRELVAGECAYANICEQCENFLTTPELAPVIESQLQDVRRLEADAAGRGWASEQARHGRVATRLEWHLHAARSRQASA
jgi:integrase